MDGIFHVLLYLFHHFCIIIYLKKNNNLARGDENDYEPQFFFYHFLESI